MPLYFCLNYNKLGEVSNFGGKGCLLETFPNLSVLLEFVHYIQSGLILLVSGPATGLKWGFYVNFQHGFKIENLCWEG